MNKPPQVRIKKQRSIQLIFNGPEFHRIFLDENHAMVLQNFLRSKGVQCLIEYRTRTCLENEFPWSRQFCLKVKKEVSQDVLYSYLKDYLVENGIDFSSFDYPQESVFIRMNANPPSIAQVRSRTRPLSDFFPQKNSDSSDISLNS